MLTVTRIANLHYFEFTRKYRTVRDKHPFYELLYVDKGAITVEAEHYSGRLADGQLIIHMPCEEHSLSCDDSVGPNVIIIGFEADCGRLAEFSQVPVTLDGMQKKELAEVLKEGMSIWAPPYDTPYLPEMTRRAEIPWGAEEMFGHRLEMFLLRLIRGTEKTASGGSEPHTDSALLDSVNRYITEHYRQKITLDQLCLLFGMNKTTLCADFREAYGESVISRVNSLRVSDAKRLLREGNLSVTEISDAVGFSSIHYFCRIFKRITGQSPGDYERTVRARLDI